MLTPGAAVPFRAGGPEPQIGSSPRRVTRWMTRWASPKSPTTACCVVRLSQKPMSPVVPVVAHRVLGLHRVLVEEGEQRVALGPLELLDVRGEAGVHEQRPARRSRGGCGRPGARPARARRTSRPPTCPRRRGRGCPGTAPCPSCTAVSVDEERLQRRAERLERGLLVGEERVAAGVGDDDGPQDRAERRARHEGDVGVPVDARGSRVRDVAVAGVELARPSV